MSDPQHILLVEDDQSVRESLRYLLESWGYRVDEAEDGVRGIKHAIVAKPETVLVDLGIPLVDGCEVARQVRSARGDDVLLVAVTASTYKGDRVRIMTAGFDLFFAKPVDPETLRQSLVR
jgi:DNA-binding response OmpR family regulator